jgi:hypothetical protein
MHMISKVANFQEQKISEEAECCKQTSEYRKTDFIHGG